MDFPKTIRILWNILSAIAIAAGIYQGYITFIAPKAELELVVSSSSFELPGELDPIFSSASKDDRQRLETAYSIIKRNTLINSITHAGLHNNGEKSAMDIRVTFPGARLISVRSDGKELQTVKDEPSVELQRLLPNSSVYFVVWGRDDGKEKENAEPISAVHSEGIVSINTRVTLPSQWKWIEENWLLMVFLLLLISSLAYLGYLLLDESN